MTVAERYKLELSAGEERRFWLVDLWRSASLPRYAGGTRGVDFGAVDRWFSKVTAVPPTADRAKASRAGDLAYNTILVLVTAGLLVAAVRFVLSGVGIGEVGHAARSAWRPRPGDGSSDIQYSGLDAYWCRDRL